MNPTSIVIPAYIKNQQLFQMTNDLLVGLGKTHGINNCEIILVDDGGEQKYIQLLKKLHPNYSWIHNETNQGFAKSVNNGIRKASKDWILLLNNDIQILQYDWLIRFIGATEQLNFSLAAPKQSILDETWNYILDIDRYKYKEDKCFSYLVGWALLVRKEVFDVAGLLTEQMGIGFWEDVEFCFRIKNHYPQFKMGVVEGINNVKLYHKEHTTFKAVGVDLAEQYTKNRKIFLDTIIKKV